MINENNSLYARSTRRWTDLVASAIVNAVSRAANYPRRTRQLLAFAMDCGLAVAATWIAWSLRVGRWDLFGSGQLQFVAAVLVFWTVIAISRRTYASLIRYSGGRTMAGLTISAALLVPPLVVAFVLRNVPGIPRTLVLLQPIVFLLLLATSRIGLRFILIEALNVAAWDAPRRNVAIYGSGSAGKQLALLLRHEPQFRLVAFVEDDPRLIGAEMDGVGVILPEELNRLIERGRVDEVLLALPNVGRQKRREIVEGLSEYPVQVRTLPSFGGLIEGKVTLNDLRQVNLEELLGRDPVPPQNDRLAAHISGKVVMVTGAGGSIGSELVRQIAKLQPAQLVLVEMSEYALYSIDSEIAKLDLGISIATELVNVVESGVARRLVERYRPATIFHAAAYKHVPLVEANPLAGIHNNVFGTLNMVRAARDFGGEHFVLVSTDKAVRPTNIMGASKRICELVLQSLAAQDGPTNYSMVRFGNVLGSSGSVVPLFRQQIEGGGPVTLTHRDVTRFFMTIPEAALLVMQAGAMARGGEVFVLDMGESVRIYDLAATMIKLSGLTVRDKDNPAGDIEIQEVGLRPGEKLYEELLIGNAPQPTSHPRIFHAHEEFLSWRELEPQLAVLAEAIEKGDASAALRVVQDLVPDYRPTPNSDGSSGACMTAVA